jgi:phage terminase large subunit
MQKQFHLSDAKIRFLVGGFGSGKTYCGCKEVIYRVSQHHGGLWLIGRAKYSALKQTTQRTFFEACAPIYKQWVKKWHDTDHLLTVRTVDGGEAQVLFWDLEDEHKLRSLQLSGFMVDEGSEIGYDIFKTLIVRARLPMPEGEKNLGIVVTNPTNKEHWCYRSAVGTVEHPKLPDSALFRSRMRDNPYLAEDYMQGVEASLDPETRRVYLDGEWGSIPDGDPVFPEFRRRIHSTTRPVYSDSPLVIGWDFGFRRPCAVLAQQQGPVLVIYDCILGKDIPIEDFNAEVMAKVNNLTPSVTPVHFGDPAGGQRSQSDGVSLFSILARMGTHIKPASNKILDGTNLIRMRLGRLSGDDAQLCVHTKADPMIFEMFEGGYHFPKLKAGSQHPVDPVPFKDGVYDHIADALRYLVMGLYGADMSKNFRPGNYGRTVFDEINTPLR